MVKNFMVKKIEEWLKEANAEVETTKTLVEYHTEKLQTQEEERAALVNLLHIALMDSVKKEAEEQQNG